MTLELVKKREIRRLVMMSLNGDATSADTGQLGDMLTGDIAAQNYYFDLLDISKTLHNAPWLSESKSLPLASDDVFDEHMWQMLTELEKTAPAVPKPVLTESPSSEKRSTGSTDTPVRLTNTVWPKVFSAAALIGLGLFIVALLSKPAGKPVSRVSSLIHAEWASPDQELEVGQWMDSQDKLRHLTAGIVKLTYDNHAEVLIEGPAQFTCLSDNALRLARGRAYAYVPGSAKGFTIYTPSSQLIDLGTEFGVLVDNERSSTVQVFQGETALIPYRGIVKEWSLKEGMAKQVKADTYHVFDTQFNHQAFVRYTNPDGTFIWRGNAFSLADCIGSGNGFGTGRLNAGISFLTAQMGIYEQLTLIRGSNDYHAVTTNPFIDGVFIPSGQGQSVSSTGLRFHDCPITSGFQGGGAVFNGVSNEPFTTVGESQDQNQLNHADNEPFNMAAIFLHANAGITFDLMAIQSSLQGVVIDKFVTRCGIPKADASTPYRGMGRMTLTENTEPRADVIVLIDGQPVFEQEVIPSLGAVDINITLKREDRFLTLIVTEGTDEEFLQDQVLLTAPRIILKRQSSPERSHRDGRINH